MQIFSTFENNIFLEIAISNLEKIGIKRENIYAVPLDHREETRKIFDTLHRSDGISLIDIAMPLATAFSVITASLGFELKWGPIYWGLIGAVCGFMIGLAVRLLIVLITNKKTQQLKGKQSEVVLIIECEEEKGEMVEKILWEHLAIGLAKVME
ncbi:hypothetical protein GLW07_17210 [Bacillus hwajinpoensis]|uniref:Uncharacterized protein n=1 Tax=Guptibacillus hwajinpoensis TaxID=208199 RepID=A0A845F2S6_9BACL|nr:hypothetical protein [Pseudalkalibacillus hwajinpoensis]MYL65099.1 hypothetical protein [Pseudalkalibacillus hwajinpoensis]